MENTVGDRIKQVRKQLCLTQQKFADSLGLKRNTVGGYEIGTVVPSDRTLLDICENYHVNEAWLRTGEGDMFVKLSRSQEISDFVADILKGEEDNFKRRFVAMLSRLDEDEWALLAKMAEEMTKE